MKAGRELDALIALKLFDLKLINMSQPIPNEPGKFGMVLFAPDDGKHIHELDLPYYSTDISAAWKVIEKLTEDGDAFTLLYDHGWFANKDGVYEVCETTAPHAICIAALAAKEIDV